MRLYIAIRPCLLDLKLTPQEQYALKVLIEMSNLRTNETIVHPHQLLKGANLRRYKSGLTGVKAKNIIRPLAPNGRSHFLLSPVYFSLPNNTEYLDRWNSLPPLNKTSEEKS